MGTNTKHLPTKTLAAITIAVLLYTMAPTSAYACSGILDCTFGWTDRAEVAADRDAEIARINAERDRAIADAEARQQLAIEQAQAEVERVRQQQFATEAERDKAIAETQRKADEYKAMIAALTSEKLAGINSNTQTQIAALHGAAEIAIAGITEAGTTERWRVFGGWLFSIVAVFVVGVLFAQLLRQRHEQMTVHLLPGETYNRQQLPRPHVMIAQRTNQKEIVRYE